MTLFLYPKPLVTHSSKAYELEEENTDLKYFWDFNNDDQSDYGRYQVLSYSMRIIFPTL